MRLLVVQDSADLGRLWCRFFQRHGLNADLAVTQVEAMAALADTAFDALIVDPMLDRGGGITVADFATYRNPDILILAVTRSTFFSESAIFDLIPNARGVLHTPVRPGDMVAYLEHYDRRGAARREVREA